jgi:hypothetical protein
MVKHHRSQTRRRYHSPQRPEVSPLRRTRKQVPRNGPTVNHHPHWSRTSRPMQRLIIIEQVFFANSYLLHPRHLLLNPRLHRRLNPRRIFSYNDHAVQGTLIYDSGLPGRSRWPMKHPGSKRRTRHRRRPPPLSRRADLVRTARRQGHSMEDVLAEFALKPEDLPLNK